MKIVWHVTARDMARVKVFFKEHANSPFGWKRISTNLRQRKPPITQTVFWDRMVGCLLTTQQRSGPDSAVSRFIQTRPGPLRYQVCVIQADFAGFCGTTLRAFGGFRRSNVIGQEIAANLGFLQEGGWTPTLANLEKVRRRGHSPETECQVAAFLAENLKGFGPKQSPQLATKFGPDPIQPR